MINPATTKYYKCTYVKHDNIFKMIIHSSIKLNMNALNPKQTA